MICSQQRCAACGPKTAQGCLWAVPAMTACGGNIIAGELNRYRPAVVVTPPGQYRLRNFSPKQLQLPPLGAAFTARGGTSPGFGFSQTGCSYRHWALFPAREISAAGIMAGDGRRLRRRGSRGPSGRSRPGERSGVRPGFSPGRPRPPHPSFVPFPPQRRSPQDCLAVAAASQASGSPPAALPEEGESKGPLLRESKRTACAIPSTETHWRLIRLQAEDCNSFGGRRPSTPTEGMKGPLRSESARRDDRCPARSLSGKAETAVPVDKII